MEFSVTDRTTLEDLLGLKLHLLEDKVNDIVDKAVKEMGIEKVFLQLLICNKYFTLNDNYLM